MVEQNMMQGFYTLAKQAIHRLAALSLVAALCLSWVGTTAHAVPFDDLTPQYITQSGGSFGPHADTMSAYEFAQLLNTKHVAKPEIVYTLLEDIELDAAWLDDTYFTKETIHDNFIFYGSLDGGGHTITVNTENLTQGTPARPLFFSIGSFYLYPREMNNLYSADQYIRDLTVKYTGDVLGSGFAYGSVYNTDIDNLTIDIDGDILPGLTYAATRMHQVAVGFAYSVHGYAEAGETADLSLTNKTITNVTITAHNIGNDIEAEADPDDKPILTVAGFCNKVGLGLDISHITLNYENMFLRTYTQGENSTFLVAGFASWVQNDPIKFSSGPVEYGPPPILDDINIHVRGDMHIVFEDRATLGFGYTGVYGVAGQLKNLSNSSVTVGGDMIAQSLDTNNVTLATSDSACVMGIGSTGFYDAQEGNSGPHFINNTVTVDGSVTARSRGQNSFVGSVAVGMKSQTYSSQGNAVTIGGNVVLERIGDPLTSSYIGDYNCFYGLDSLLRSSTDNQLTIKGSVRSHQPGGNMDAKLDESYNLFSGGSAYCGVARGNQVTIEGDVDLYSDRWNALVYGFGPPRSVATSFNWSDNKVTIGGKISVGTGSDSRTARFVGFIPSAGEDSAGSRDISGNELAFHGDITVQAPAKADLFGFAYSLGAGATCENNKVYMGGDVTVETVNHKLDNQSALVTGFAGILHDHTENNAVHIAGDVKITSRGNAEFFGFVYEVAVTAGLIENTLRIDGGVTAKSTGSASTDGAHAAGFASDILGTAEKNALFISNGLAATHAGDGSSSTASFALKADDGSVVNENTIIGRPGLPNLYSQFILEVIDGADVSNNFFTSALGGQRVSNLLNYNTGSQQFEPASDTRQDRLIVSNAAHFAGNPPYITENGLATALSLGGPDAPGAALSAAHLLANTISPAALSLWHLQGGLYAVKDLPGIAHPFLPNRIQGTVYYDALDNGSKDTPLPGITINVKLNGALVATGKTNASGQYDIEMPLSSCLILTHSVVLEVPSGLTQGTAADNAFKNTGSVTQLLGYSANYGFDGYLTGTVYRVTYHSNFDSDVTEAVYPLPEGAYQVEDYAALTALPARTGHTFRGWAESPGGGVAYSAAACAAGTATLTLSDDTDLYAVWQKDGNGGNGGGGTTYTVTYHANGGTGSHQDAGLSAGSTYTIRTLTATGITHAEKTFIGWNTKADGTGTDYAPGETWTVNASLILYAQWEERPALVIDDHFAYIIGFEDGTVRPTANITRAEVATIYFRLLTEASRSSFWATTNRFSDVDAQSWYNNAVSTISKAGIITGYPDGTFGGGRSITRAEFAAIAARFDSDVYEGPDQFSDISGSWAAAYINRAAEKGWILGYPDGTFRPDQYITRAEAMTLINRVLGRSDIEAMHPDMKTWADNAVTDWHYEAVQEATNSHAYTRDEAGRETWTEVQPAPDWAALEHAWSTANAR